MKNSPFSPITTIVAIIGISILAVSCEKNETDVPERPAFEDALFLSVSNQQVGLFEQLSFDIKTLQKDNEKGGLAYYLGTHLDSVKWELPDILDESYTGVKMPVKHLQCFYLPGKYKARITGYRDSLAISSDSVELEVKPSGDFLGIEWANEEDATMRNFKFVSLVKGFTLNLTYTLTEEPYILLSYRINNYLGREEYKEEMAAVRPFLHHYITSLYGECRFNYEGEDITQSPLKKEYEKRFLNTFADSSGSEPYYYPLAIWDTPACHVALIGSAPSQTGEISISYYKVIAEPLKIILDYHW
ncbi:MAG: hypothetical protein LBH58_13910 [Tannerellaceae bacterium]|jgi:hypothetical protein|nr:hypothetical protein [Tannerellaceae bacterium]